MSDRIGQKCGLTLTSIQLNYKFVNFLTYSTQFSSPAEWGLVLLTCPTTLELLPLGSKIYLHLLVP